MAYKDPDQHRAYNRAYHATNRDQLNARRRAHYQENRAKANESTDAWRRANLEKHRAYAKKWREANQEKHRAYNRAYTKANPEKQREYQRAYYEANPEKMREKGRANRHIRRVRLLGNGGSVVRRDWERLVNRYHGLCAYCDERLAEHLEHIIPIARGGRHTIGNVLPACATCNQSKGAKLLIEWDGRRQVAA